MDTLIQPLIYVLAFVAVVLLVQTVSSLAFASRSRNQRVNRRLTLLASGVKPAEVYAQLINRPTGSNLSNPFLMQTLAKVWNYTRQAGLAIEPLRLLMIVLGVALALWVLSLVLLRFSNPGGFALNASVSLVGALLLSFACAYLFISSKRTTRMRKLEDQLPLALDIVNRALRAGHPVVSAVQLAAAELGDPIGTEFGLIVDETTYGSEFREALANFARRTGSGDARFFAVSVSIQSETGGNLAQILDGLATVMRGRATLAKRVKALASEGKASAVILSLLPVFLIGQFMLVQPQFYTSKFGDPLFWIFVFMIGVLYIIGQIMIRQIINFKY